MQATVDQVIINDVQIASVSAAGFTATPIQDELSWGEGAIQPQATYPSDEDQTSLIQAVLQSIEPVTDGEMAYSACTDGRIPVKLMNGQPIPVREQMVGADMVSAFFAAEILGAHFYQNTQAPVADRVREVARFLQTNGLLPSSHIACGAAAGFATIMQNTVRFLTDERFVARLKELAPDVLDEETMQALTIRLADCLSGNQYEALSAQIFLDAVETTSGQRAIAELKDDNRGVHGHVEEHIIRLRTPGYAINEAKVAELTNGREVFGVNDARIKKLARLFRHYTDHDYKLAYLALEVFADAGHGTLAKDLPTWIVDRTA